MFRISAETCRSFTLAEILIMGAMNAETIRMGLGGGRPNIPVTQRGSFSARHSLGVRVRKALQM